MKFQLVTLVTFAVLVSGNGLDLFNVFDEPYETMQNLQYLGDDDGFLEHLPYRPYPTLDRPRRQLHRYGTVRDHFPTIHLPENYSNSIPPQKYGNKAEFDVLIFSVRDINELSMELSLEVRIQMFWRDQRLQSWSRYIEPGKKFFVLPQNYVDDIWLPDIYVENLKGIIQPVLLAKPASVRAYKNGVMRYSTRITLKVACKMNFHYYPADTQKCAVEMKSYAYDNKTLEIKWKETERKEDADSVLTVVDSNLDLPNFDFNLELPKLVNITTRNNNTYSGIRFEVLLTRNLNYHLMQTYVPSTLFVIVSWLSFLVPADSVPGRMAICMTTLLTLTSMFAAVRSNVPKVSYIKAIDIWMVACAFFVFLTLLQYTIVLKFRSLHPKSKETNKDSEPQKQEPPTVIRQKGDVVQVTMNAALASAEEYYERAVLWMERCSWAAIIISFIIFNCTYWPWLIIRSGYNEDRNRTRYYTSN